MLSELRGKDTSLRIEIILSFNKVSSDKIESNKIIIAKRLSRYQSEVDPLTLEAVRIGISTAEGKKLKDQANTIVEQIKIDLPKEI